MESGPGLNEARMSRGRTLRLIKGSVIRSPSYANDSSLFGMFSWLRSPTDTRKFVDLIYRVNGTYANVDPSIEAVKVFATFGLT